MGRGRKDSPVAGWKAKLHALFFELAGLNKEFEKQWAKLQGDWKRELKAVGPNPELQKKISTLFLALVSQLDRWIEERLVDIDSRFKNTPYNPRAYGYFTLDLPISDSEGIREYVHFHRHGESLRATKAKDALGDLNAWDKISRTERDFRILAFGKGPITPFQEDEVHRQLLQLVICYENEHLTAEELAECFDEYCACGKENHDADALRKMRDRFEKELRAGPDNHDPPRENRPG